jgi:hypothetical protein
VIILKSYTSATEISADGVLTKEKSRNSMTWDLLAKIGLKTTSHITNFLLSVKHCN